MAYKGYQITLVNRPQPFKKDNMAYDILCEGKIIKSNFSTSELCKHYIDACIARGKLPDLSGKKRSERSDDLSIQSISSGT